MSFILGDCVDASHVYSFHGMHIIGDLYGIDFKLLTNNALLEATFIKSVKRTRATLCSIQKTEFHPFGFTIIGLLSESHASIHVYPEHCSMFIDIFTCGYNCLPKNFVDHLVNVLKPRRVITSTIQRGGRSKRHSLGNTPGLAIPQDADREYSRDPI